jgi:hypothetical protein
MAAVTYLYPVAGATAPTLLQDYPLSQVIADVYFADGDAGPINITHNWGLSTAQLAAGIPQISHWATVLNGTVYPGLSFSTSTNAVAVSKGSTAANTGGTWRVVLERHTIIK